MFLAASSCLLSLLFILVLSDDPCVDEELRELVLD
jgi:hypothetical protein